MYVLFSSLCWDPSAKDEEIKGILKKAKKKNKNKMKKRRWCIVHLLLALSVLSLSPSLILLAVWEEDILYENKHETFAV